MTCWLAQFRPDVPCEGRLVRCHLLPRQEIRRVWRSAHHGAGSDRAYLPWKTMRDAMDDPRSWVWGCGGGLGVGGHHGMLDHSRTLKIPWEALPPELHEFAADLGASAWLEREYARS